MEMISFAAVLDLLDGYAARALGATSAIGAQLDLIVDGCMWTLCIYLGFIRDGHSRLSVLGWLVLTLEWACTLSLFGIQMRGDDKGWKDALAVEGSRITTLYVAHGMRNALAALGNVSHLVLPLALFYLAHGPEDPSEGGAWEVHSYAAVAVRLLVLLALPGFVLYLWVTWALLRARIERTIAHACPPHLWPLLLYHVATVPLLLRAMLPLRATAACMQESQPSAIALPLLKAAASRLATAALVAAHHRLNAIPGGGGGASSVGGQNGHGRRGNGALALACVSDGWVFLHWQLMYWEVGELLPIVHPSLYFPTYDLSLDDTIRQLEQTAFGSEPAASLRHGLHRAVWGCAGSGVSAAADPACASHGAALSEALHLVYFSFVPLLATTAACLRLWRPLRPWSALYESNVTAAYGGCCLWWLVAPVFGPAVTLVAETRPPAASPATAATIASSAMEALSGDGSRLSLLLRAWPTTQAEAAPPVASHVWTMGRRYASVGTALPSSHCAITAAMLLSLVAAGRYTDAPSSSSSSSSSSVRAACLGFYGALVTAIWFSTVYCGFHYVSDVVAGIGVACLVGSWRRPAGVYRAP